LKRVVISNPEAPEEFCRRQIIRAYNLMQAPSKLVALFAIALSRKLSETAAGSVSKTKKASSKKIRKQGSVPAKLPGLKEIAQHLGLSSASVSMVINDVPLAQALLPETRARILAAAKEFNYRPNLVARALSKRESRTVGVIGPESSDGYYPRVMRGIEEALLDREYLYFTVSHLSREELIREYPMLLRQRAVDGLIFVNTKILDPPGIPAVSISYSCSEPGVTSIVVDQQVGTRLAIQHLHRLGHKRILFMKGQKMALNPENDGACCWMQPRR
jgi:Bacterial regulatory proteins, lacI family/Periplasmic binding proteins and sugar binding domain of LacI family